MSNDLYFYSAILLIFVFVDQDAYLVGWDSSVVFFLFFPYFTFMYPVHENLVSQFMCDDHFVGVVAILALVMVYFITLLLLASLLYFMWKAICYLFIDSAVWDAIIALSVFVSLALVQVCFIY